MLGTAVDYGLTALSSVVLSSGSLLAMFESTDPAETERLASNVFQDPALAARLAPMAPEEAFDDEVRRHLARN